MLFLERSDYGGHEMFLKGWSESITAGAELQTYWWCVWPVFTEVYE